MGVMQSEQTDTNAAGNSGVADGAVDSNDPTFYYATDSGGQRTAVFRGNDADPKETYINHAGGMRSRGPVVRDRDDALATDVAGWARDAAASVRYERYYFVNDRRGDVVALLAAVGTLVESYRYSATGMPFGQPLGDVNSDGTVAGTSTGADFTQADWSRTNTYRFRSDVDLDGQVTFADTGTVTAEDGQVRGRANFSRAAVRNTLGKSGQPWAQASRGWVDGQGQRLGDVGLLAGPGMAASRSATAPVGPRGPVRCGHVQVANRGPEGGSEPRDCSNNFVPVEPDDPTIHDEEPPVNPAAPCTMTDDQVCAEAKRRGLDLVPNGDGTYRRSAGGVVCYCGRKISCAWGAPGTPVGPGPAGTQEGNHSAEQLIRRCVRYHEDQHHWQVTCPNDLTGKITRPPFADQQASEAERECNAYSEELLCARNLIGSCPSQFWYRTANGPAPGYRAACVRRLRSYVDDICAQLDRLKCPRSSNFVNDWTVICERGYLDSIFL